MKNSKYLIISFALLIFNIVEGQSVSDSASDYNESGIEKYKLGDYIGAIQDYSKAIKLASDTAGANILDKFQLGIILSQAYSFRGNAKSALKDYRSALQDYDKAIELHSIEEYDHTAYNRGMAKAHLKDYQGAIEDLNKAIQDLPNFGDAFYGRGIIKYYLKDKEGACLDWSKAGELGYSKAYDLIKQFCNEN